MRNFQAEETNLDQNCRYDLRDKDEGQNSTLDPNRSPNLDDSASGCPTLGKTS
jgi:hypothetical protein